MIYRFDYKNLPFYVSGFSVQSTGLVYFDEAGIPAFAFTASPANVMRFCFACLKLGDRIRSLCVGFGLYPSKPNAGLFRTESTTSLTDNSYVLKCNDLRLAVSNRLPPLYPSKTVRMPTDCIAFLVLCGVLKIFAFWTSEGFRSCKMLFCDEIKPPRFSKL